jgi:hypothetical protein
MLLIKQSKNTGNTKDQTRTEDKRNGMGRNKKWNKWRMKGKEG